MTSDQADKIHRLSKAFSPSAPIAKRDLFLGRIKQLRNVVDTVLEKGQHFVLFGERGVGKTSLANIIHDDLREVIVSKVTCSRDDSFKGIWSKALGRVKFESERSGIGYSAERRTESVQLDMFLPAKDDITSLDVLCTLEKVQNNLLFIFDEFDSIKSESVKGSFADLIKALSDNVPNVTVGIVGVADDVATLLGEHASLERCVRQILMPRMSEAEIEAIVLKGVGVVGLAIDAPMMRRVIDFSLGFPYFAHLLSKYACEAAVLRGADVLQDEDFSSAVDKSLENATQSIQIAYKNAADSSGDDNRFEQIVGACALAEVDQYGAFTARAFSLQYSELTRQVISPQMANYYLNELCGESHGAALEKLGNSKKRKYSFRSPLLKAFVRLRMYKSGHLHQATLSI